MFETSVISNSQSIGTASITQQNDMGKEQFLQLLVAQLQHQDPLSPIESQDFAAQLAQFSNVELLGSIDANILDGTNANMALAQSITNTMAANFIGREVTVLGDHLQIGTGEVSSIDFRLASEADSVTITIYDENGALVRTFEENRMDAGMQKFEWDGKDEDGVDLKPGKYTYKVEASDADGNDIQVMQMAKGLVEAVKYAAGSAVLVVNGIEVLFSDVMQIGSI